MRVIAYCDECMKCFDDMPLFYWSYYENIVCEMIVHGKYYTLVSTLDPDISYTFEFLLRLEEQGLLLSCEQGKELIKVMACGINYIPTEKEDVDLYQVCLNIEKHHVYELDENLIED